MAESSRDTAQLIRLVYSSISEEKGGGVVRSSKNRGAGRVGFGSFYSLRVLKVASNSCLECVAHSLNATR